MAEHIRTVELDDGRVELLESCLDGEAEPNLIVIHDYRESTLDAAKGASQRDDYVSCLFNYEVEENRLVLSRVFANTDDGYGHALDIRPSFWSKHWTSDLSRNAHLIDAEVRSLIEDRYGDDVYIDTRSLFDRVRTVVRRVS